MKYEKGDRVMSLSGYVLDDPKNMLNDPSLVIDTAETKVTDANEELFSIDGSINVTLREEKNLYFWQKDGIMPRGSVRAYHLVKDWKEIKGFIEGLATEYKEACDLKIKQRQREASIHQKKADQLKKQADSLEKEQKRVLELVVKSLDKKQKETDGKVSKRRPDNR